MENYKKEMENYKKEIKNYSIRNFEINYKNDILNFSLLYRTKNTNNKYIIWIPGFNDYFYHVIEGNILLDNGYDLYIVEFENFGNNLHKKNNPLEIESMHHLIKQIEEIEKYILNQEKQYLKKFLYGHSLGGLISIYYNNYTQIKYDGIILNSPLIAFSGMSKIFTIISHIFVFILGNTPFFNNIKISPYKSTISKDFDKTQYVENPTIKLRYIKEVYVILKDLKSGKFYTQIPIILLTPSKQKNEDDIFGEDILNIEKTINNVPYLGPNIEIYQIDKVHHDVLNTSISNKKLIISLILNWLDNLL